MNPAPIGPNAVMTSTPMNDTAYAIRFRTLACVYHPAVAAVLATGIWSTDTRRYNAFAAAEAARLAHTEGAA